MEIAQQQRKKEEYAIVLDFLPNGYHFDKRPSHKKTPIAQAIGKTHFVLLELVPKKDILLKPNQEVYIGDGKRDEVHHIIGKIGLQKLSETAKSELEYVIKDLVAKNNDLFIDFFNKAQPLTTRMHQLELLPGLGKKHMWEIIEQRQVEPFKNFEDLKNRVKLLPDPEKVIVKRIISEIEGKDKHRLFTE
ncbi:MAG: DUF655 domain-containing protein [Nanoarchaeota archaeon]|nr:DUF655 domain-containing protein [Nanoarchaeota archaeon]